MTNIGVNDIIWRCTTLHIENNVENMSLQFISICQKMFLSLWNTVKNYKMNFFLLFTTILGIQARSFNWNKVRIRLLTRESRWLIVNMYFQRQSGWTLNSIGYNAGLSKHFEFLILTWVCQHFTLSSIPSIIAWIIIDNHYILTSIDAEISWWIVFFRLSKLSSFYVKIWKIKDAWLHF